MNLCLGIILNPPVRLYNEIVVSFFGCFRTTIPTSSILQSFKKAIVFIVSAGA